MGRGVARKIIDAHLVAGTPEVGEEIGLRVDQTLSQDATGTLVMQELEALGLDRARTEVSVQYVEDARRGRLAHLRGGFARHAGDRRRRSEVALAIAEEPLYLRMPEIWGIELTGELPPWTSAKDVILELLRRHGVQGGRNRILKYHGPGVATLSAMDRHVIANMGAELGATTSVFPADEAVAAFLRGEDRADDFTELTADDEPGYDRTDHLDLSTHVDGRRLPMTGTSRCARVAGRFLNTPAAALLRGSPR